MMGPQAKRVRYAVYTRQSVDKGDEFSSCQVQFLTCKDSAKATGAPDLQWIGQRFDDEGYSGATLDRPAMRRLRKLIDLGGIDRLYAVALDRLTRSMRDAIVLLDEFEKAGVELRLVNQPQLTTGPEGRFLRHMLAAFAEFERDMIATRIAESRAYLKKHGRRLAGPPPFGYDADPVTKQLVPNKAEARRVRAMFKRAAAGQTPSQIAGRVNHLGWRTKAWTSRRSGEHRGGGKWTARLVTRLLRSPVYLGRFAAPNGDRAGSHDAIVPQELFDAAQAQLAGRRTSSSTSRAAVRFPLRGKILCPRCGRPLSTYTLTKPLGARAKKTLRYYRCRSTAGGRRPCRGVSYPAWELEQFVREQLASEAAWQEILRQAKASPRMASELAHLWQAMGQLTQERMLSSVVQEVRFLEGNSSIVIRLNRSVVENIKAFVSGASASDC
jgi:site-specific DNA recombinase